MTKCRARFGAYKGSVLATEAAARAILRARRPTHSSAFMEGHAPRVPHATMTFRSGLGAARVWSAGASGEVLEPVGHVWFMLVLNMPPTLVS